MAITVEQLTVIRSSLDPTGYVAGAQKVQQAATQTAQTVTAANDQVVQSQARVTRSIVDGGTAYNRVAAQIDPAVKNAQAYARAQDVINRAVTVGRTTQEEANRLLDLARARYTTTTEAAGKLTAANGNAAFATRQLGVQTVQALSSIASGQPILTTFIQQGHQLVDVALSTGTGFGVIKSAASSAFAAITSPAGLAIAGIAAVAGAVTLLAMSAERTATKLHDMQNALRATRADYVSLGATAIDVAKRVAASSTLSGEDAKSASRTISSAAGYNGSPAELERLVRVSADLDAVFGKAGDGAKMLADALNDPARVAQDLANKHFPGMSQSLAYQIKLQAQAGDRAGAFAKTLEILQKQTTGAAEPTTKLQKAINDFKNVFSGASDEGEKFATNLGTPIANAAAAAVDNIRKVITAVGELANAVPTWMIDLYKWINAHDPTMLAIGAVAGLAGGGSTPAGNAQSGNVLTSTAGAQGIFQIMPGTAKQLGIDATKPDQNIAGGLQYINDLLQKSGGNVPAALKTYGGFVNADPTGYINKVSGADTSILSTRSVTFGGSTMSVDKAIDMWGRVLGLPADVIALGKKIAVVESGGQQFTGGAAAQKIGSVVTGAGQEYGPPASPMNKPSYDEGFKTAQSLSPLSMQISENSAQQQLLQKDIKTAREQGDTKAVEAMSQALDDLRGKASDLITEQQRLARSAADSVAPLNAQAGAARRLAEIEQTFAEAARKSGTQIDRTSLLRAQAAELTKLAVSYQDQVQQVDLATEAQLRINKAYDGTTESLERANNYNTAYTEAMKSFIPGSEQFTAAVDNMKSALDRGTAASIEFKQKQSAWQSLQSTVGNAFDSIGNAIMSSTSKGENALTRLKNTAVSTLQQIMNEVWKLAVTNPLMNAIFGESSSRPTMNTMGGLLGSLFGGGGKTGGGSSGGGTNISGAGGLLGAGFSKLGNLLGIGTAADTNAATLAAWQNEPLYSSASLYGAASTAPTTFVDSGVFEFHRGGVVGVGGVPRSVSASAFMNAPRFHTGTTMASDEFAAILQRGERVLTQPQQRKVAAAANDRGHTINVTVAGAQSSDAARRTGYQVGTAAAGALSRTAARRTG